MNAYIIVEGERTEMSVYPAWLSILAPNMHRIEDARELSHDSYYLFCGHGIPHIYKHVTNAVSDINEINARGGNKYDCLIVCLDTEDESREYIEQSLHLYLQESGVQPLGFDLLVFEHKVCMETWFLGNRRIFKSNPNGQEMIRYLRHYNVGVNNPEDMDSINPERCNKASFHLRYLKAMLAERNLRYEKNNTGVVCSSDYLKELIARFEQTHHLKSFGSWYEFVITKMARNNPKEAPLSES